MNTISITTAQNISLEYELGSLGDRIVGYIIDFLILAAYAIIITLIISNTTLFKGSNWLVFMLYLPIFFYSLVSELLMNGQSVGKRVMAIKVISISGEQPSLSQYLIRWLFRAIDFYLISPLIGLITVAVSYRKQRLGDMVAGTVVIKTKMRTTFGHTIYAPAEHPQYEVAYPEVIHLKDSDIQLVKEVMQAAQRGANAYLLLQTQQKIEQVLNIHSREQEPVYFLQKVLTDYNHLTSTL